MCAGRKRKGGRGRPERDRHKQRERERERERERRDREGDHLEALDHHGDIVQAFPHARPSPHPLPLPILVQLAPRRLVSADVAMGNVGSEQLQREGDRLKAVTDHVLGVVCQQPQVDPQKIAWEESLCGKGERAAQVRMGAS